MDLQEISRVTERELRAALGPELVAHVSVSEESVDDGVTFLDIRAHSRDQRLPTARQSLDVQRRLRHRLAELGERRSPNLIFVTAAEAA